MKKLFIVTICFFALVTLNGQIVQERLPGAEEISNRRSPFNLEELKVRWKKAALENCPGVPCITVTVPGPPTSVTASAGNASASVSFVAPTNNGGSAITGYTVTSSPGGITATGTTSPINVTGLTNGTAYTFRVIATNVIGNSVASSASTAVTPVAPNTVPGPPTSVVATAGNASASVAFVAPTNNGGSAITGYTVTSSPGGITATGTTSPINVTGLTNGTAYTFTIVATNAIGNSSPSTASSAVTPLVPFTCGTSTVADIDGNTYNTVLIGTQCWTKSNLKVTKYNDGTDIPEITGSQTWDNTVVTGARTVYNDDPINLTRYGYLYNWFAAKGISTGGSIIYKNICPTGWHVPTDNEWESLIRFIDPAMTVHTSGGTESSTAGKKLKSSSTLWQTDPNPGTDDFGFSALPGGRRLQSGSDFSEVEQRAYFWSTDLFTNGRGFTRVLYYNFSSVNKDNYVKETGRSIRCIKD
jgi:uncharacterized protein (TIGR02145 family)